MTSYNDFFFRPNTSSVGDIPAQQPLYTSPDIICSQTTPIEDFTNVLKNNYNSSSYSSNIEIGYENYFYVRGRNLSSSQVNRQISLYYTPSSVINWPSQWVGNVIQTDKSSPISLLTNVAPGAVAVAPDTFLWKPPAPSGSDHYCLFSYSTDAADPKPIPGSDGMTYEDMATLVSTNLNIGWKNVVAITNQPPTWVMNHGLAVPLSVGSPMTATVYVVCHGLVGGSVAFQGSNSEGADHPIVQPKTDITQDGQIVGIQVVLQPGFQCVVSISFWANGHSFASGAHLDFEANYDPEAGAGTGAQLQAAIARNLIDPNYVLKFQTNSNVQPKSPIFLGRIEHIYQ
ncbi:hypothetical protein EI613_12360 [Azospirillum sp. 412522]|nr:hypothetical protein [Azospirillum sp. 412522]MBY6262695.1 hypothetical protein [Azospirillum sp. 412522]